MHERQVSMGLMGCQYDREKVDQWQEVVDGFGISAMQRERDDIHFFFFFFITILI